MTRKIFLSIVLLPVLAGFARADDPTAAAAASVKPWKNGAELSLLTQNGNSKGTTTSAKDTFDYRWSHYALELMGSGLGSSSGNTVTAEQYDSSEKLTRNFTEDNYVYEITEWDKNRFAGIQDRYQGSAGLGRMLLNLTNDKIKMELGPGYVNEQRTDETHSDFVSGRAYAKYTHTLSATANVSQDAEYIHDFDNPKNYRLNTESAVIASLSTHLSLKASFVWKRVALPIAGAAKDDTTTGVALIVNY